MKKLKTRVLIIISVLFGAAITTTLGMFVVGVIWAMLTWTKIAYGKTHIDLSQLHESAIKDTLIRTGALFFVMSLIHIVKSDWAKLKKQWKTL